jgi:hypothetical protein
LKPGARYFVFLLTAAMVIFFTVEVCMTVPANSGKFDAIGIAHKIAGFYLREAQLWRGLPSSHKPAP